MSTTTPVATQGGGAVGESGLPGDLREALAAYAQRLRARFGSRVRFVRLFGSWARGHRERRIAADILKEGVAA